MSFYHKKLVYFFLLCIQTLTLNLFLSHNANLSAAEPSASEIVASVTFTSEDAVWKAVEQIGAEMKYAQIAKGIKEIVGAKFKKLDAIDTSAPLGIAVATNGDDIFPFGYLPLKDGVTVDERELNSIKQQIETQIQLNSIVLFVKDSKLFISLKKHQDYIPSPIDINIPESALLTVKVDLSRIPQEFIEAGFSTFRQKIAQQVSEKSDESVKSLDMLLKHYSELLNSISQYQTSFFITESNDLVFSTTINCKTGSVLADNFTDAKKSQTRWGSIMEASNPIFASITAGKRLESLKELQLYQFKNVFCKYLLNQLDVLLDNPEDFEIARQLVDILIAEESASISSGRYDAAISISNDPFVIKIGTIINDPQKIREGLQIVANRLRKENNKVDSYLQLNADEFEGFSITKLEIPISEIAPNTIAYFKEKSIAVCIGVGEGALAITLGSEAALVEAELKKMTSNAKDLTPIPTQNTFDLSQCSSLLHNILSNLEGVNPEALASVKALANAEDAKIITSYEIEDSTLNYETKFEHGLFSAIGEIIRVNIYGAKEDDSEELDDLFDDEE